jgi:integrase
MARPTKQFALDKRGNWKGYFHQPGKRATERLLIKDVDLRAQARTKAQQQSLLAELYAQKASAESSATAQVSSFESSKRAFLEFIANERSANTLKEYSHTLSQLESFEQVDLLKQQWAAAGQSPNTINKKIRTIRSFENWRVEQENNERAAKALPLVHARKFRNLKTDPANISSYSKEQADNILQLIEARIANPLPNVNPDFHRRWELLRRAWWLSRYAGLRGAELLSLRWKDIKLAPLQEDSFLDINSHEDARGKWFQVKQHHAAVVPIVHDCLIEELQSWEHDHEFVLGNYWKSSIELSRAFARLQAQVGISDDIKPVHGFRALFATELHNLGASIYNVKELLRHSSIETTERYIDKRNNKISALRSLTKAA